MLSFSSSGSSSASFKHQLSRPSSKSDEVSFALPCLSCSVSTGDSSCHVKLSQSHKTRMWRMWMCTILAPSLHLVIHTCTHSVHTFRTANFSRGDPSWSMSHPYPVHIHRIHRKWQGMASATGFILAFLASFASFASFASLTSLATLDQPGRPLVTSQLALETWSKHVKKTYQWIKDIKNGYHIKFIIVHASS